MNRLLIGLFSLATVSVAQAQAPRAAATPHERLAREIYAELIGINTVDSVDSTTRAARALAKRFLDAGFPAQDVQVLIPPNESGESNAHGRDEKVRTKSFYDGLAFLDKLVRRLATD